MVIKDGDKGIEWCPWEVTLSTLSFERESDPLPCLYKLRMCTIDGCVWANYQCSLTSEELQGIVDVDCAVEFICETTGIKRVGLTLRDILLKYFTMTDGHALIAEVHQHRVLSPVEVIIPNTEEAEMMIARMNVHLPAFCYHYLLDKGLGKPYVEALIQESCCATMTVEIPHCVWDSVKMLVTTRAAKEAEDKYSALESANWFRDEVGMNSREGKGKKDHLNPELLYKFDGDRSIKTLHERNDRARTKENCSEEDLSNSSMDSASNSSRNAQSGISFAEGSRVERNVHGPGVAGRG